MSSYSFNGSIKLIKCTTQNYTMAVVMTKHSK